MADGPRGPWDKRHRSGSPKTRFLSQVRGTTGNEHTQSCVAAGWSDYANARDAITARDVGFKIRDRKADRISARQGQSKGAEIDSLIEELIQIGRSDKFLSESTDGDRAREIGAILNGKGGMDLMKFAYYRVGRVLGGGQMRTLEVAWDSIGEWMS